ncbi:hypothetical protein [Dapis sp. BLCC M229]|uniref:hypothetical protein n=1 Tax=Dapis sp. BLCC M229 TaxID=3400188 RepID=UPI003CF76EB0
MTHLRVGGFRVKLYHVRIISDKKVFVCSRALAQSALWAKALLRTLIIIIHIDMVLMALQIIIMNPPLRL